MALNTDRYGTHSMFSLLNAATCALCLYVEKYPIRIYSLAINTLKCQMRILNMIVRIGEKLMGPHQYFSRYPFLILLCKVNATIEFKNHTFV